MKQTILFIISIVMPLCITAQSVQKTTKSVFKLTTFDSNNSVLATTHGVFVGNTGDAVSHWAPFVGASRATVEDASGAVHQVEVLYGADELYDVCRFRVSGNTVAASVATKAVQRGNKVSVVGFAKETASNLTTTVKSIETFGGKYSYLVLNNGPVNATVDGCPVINQNSQVIGLLKVSAISGEATVTDINYCSSFKVTNALAVNDPTLQSSGIRLAYPAEKEQAHALLLLAGEQSDSLKRVAYINDFIKQFPSELEGYVAHAEEELRAQNFISVDRDMQDALKNVKNKDEVHAAYAKLIYQKEVYLPNVEYPEWTLDKALSEVAEANRLNEQPAYKHQEAQIHFLKGEYDKAYEQFMALTQTDIRSGELFFEAAQCKQQLNAPQEEYIALLDQAVDACPQPLNAIAAPYVLERADAHNMAKNYRKAVADYNLYDSILGGRPLSAEFYYVREKCEMEIHQYQQALNDINRAILLWRNNALLWAEKASLHLRFQQYDDAVKSAEICMQLESDNTDAMLVRGIALCQQKRKKEGLEQLRKAQEAGDERAEALIKKYK